MGVRDTVTEYVTFKVHAKYENGQDFFVSCEMLAYQLTFF
jgi:hypothetical protein